MFWLTVSDNEPLVDHFGEIAEANFTLVFGPFGVWSSEHAENKWRSNTVRVLLVAFYESQEAFCFTFTLIKHHELRQIPVDNDVW